MVVALSVLTAMTQTSGDSTTKLTQTTTSSPWETVDRSDRSHHRSNDRMVNIHLNANRRGSLDSATFTTDQMQQFINELEAAHRSNRYADFSRVNNSESLKGGRSEQHLSMSIDLAESDSY